MKLQGILGRKRRAVLAKLRADGLLPAGQSPAIEVTREGDVLVHSAFEPSPLRLRGYVAKALRAADAGGAR